MQTTHKRKYYHQPHHQLDSIRSILYGDKQQRVAIGSIPHAPVIPDDDDDIDDITEVDAAPLGQAIATGMGPPYPAQSLSPSISLSPSLNEPLLIDTPNDASMHDFNFDMTDMMLEDATQGIQDLYLNTWHTLNSDTYSPDIRSTRQQQQQQRAVSLTNRAYTRHGKWRASFLAVIEEFTEREEKEDKASVIHTRQEVMDMKLTTNHTTDGFRREKDIMRSMNNVGLKLASHQRRFMRLAVSAVRPHIYGTEYERCMAEIARRTKETSVNPWILIQTPRRFGKTTMVALLAASLILHIPGFRIAIFSTGQNASSYLLDEIERFVGLITGSNSRISAKSKRRLQVAPPGIDKKVARSAGTLSTCTAFGGNVKTGRGYTTHMTIMEEAAHMNENLWLEVIAPALTTTNHILIAITTSQHRSNFFSQLLTRTSSVNGESLFTILIISISCDECQQRGRPEKCTHNANVLPSWKPPETHQRVMDLFGERDRRIAEQELLGLIIDETNLVFNQEAVVRFKNRPPRFIHEPPDYIYSFVDPHGGGKTSSQAIIDLICIGRHIVIIGIDLYKGSDFTESDNALQRHYQLLRRNPLYRNTPVIVFFEANGDWLRSGRGIYTIRTAIDNIRPVRHKDHLGVLTTDETKEWGSKIVDDEMRANTIHIAQQLISTSSDTALESVEELFQQLSNFKRIRYVPKNGTGRIRVKLTGKAHGMQDDLVVSLTQCCYRMRGIQAQHSIPASSWI